ncbi:MAG: sugar ABC transporter ATP-binding protein, partial [Planctomycetes bacterium]|nr:sugar ABC transporter ATP-binding protein [Planctomycetota bacterium]
STYSTKDVTIERVVNSMVGRDISGEHLHQTRKPGSVMMRVESLNAGDKVRDISFELRSGEILGVAGLMGSGRTETMRVIFGADEKRSGEIYLHGSDVPTRIKSPSDAVRSGIALLTEDRKEQGLFLPLTVRANISMVRLRDLSRFGWVRGDKERKDAEARIAAMNVKCSSPEQPVMDLSGGNQQKVIIAKWLYKNCDILIFDEPTRGIDVGAKFEIYRTLNGLAEKGKAIIVVSSELKELTAVCDRIMVLSAGRIAGEFGRDQFCEERINAAAFSNYLNGGVKDNISGKAV